MILAIDLTKTNFVNPVGTDHYALEMTKALVSGTGDDKYYLIVSSREGWQWVADTFKKSGAVKVIQLPRRPLVTQLWVALSTFMYPQIDVLWSPVPTLPLLHRPGLKIIVTVHGLEFRQGVDRIGLDWSTRWSLSFANGVITVSDTTKQRLLTEFHQPESKISVVYEGVDPRAFYSRSQSEVTSVKQKYHLVGDYFLFVGTLQPRKNLVNLIAGFSRFRTSAHSGQNLIEGGAFSEEVPSSLEAPSTDKLMHVHKIVNAEAGAPGLILAGSSGWSTAEIYAAPERFGVADLVNFVGRVPGSDLPALYSGAVATCLVSWDEGFGLPVVQSMACGRPVIISDRGALPEVAGDGGIVVDPTSPADIYRGLLEAWQRRDEAAWSQVCFRRSEMFSWERAASSLHTVLSDSVSRRTPRMTAPRLVEILGVHISNVTFDEALKRIGGFISEPRFHLVATVNPEFVLTASSDPVFKTILNQSDLSLPDGVGLQMASSYLHFFDHQLSVLTERVTGSDLFFKLCKLGSQKGWRIGLLGGQDFRGQNVCDLTKWRLEDYYPGIRVAYCSREPSDLVFTTPLDLLFVAFGAPKQEKWLSENRDQLSQVRVGIGVGGTFDYLVGKRRRAPRLLRNLRLEWLWRLLIEPRRVGRIFRAVVVFPWRVLFTTK